MTGLRMVGAEGAACEGDACLLPAAADARLDDVDPAAGDGADDVAAPPGAARR